MLSIITPVYNGRNILDRCYQSLKNQTYPNWQWVVVNDGSTDGTDVFFKNLSDERIKYIEYERNKGRAYARTCALDHCDGDWIDVWDADDIHFPDRLEKINWARKRQNWTMSGQKSKNKSVIDGVLS